MSRYRKNRREEHEEKVRGLFEGPTTSTFYVGDIRFVLVANQRAINRLIALFEANVELDELVSKFKLHA